MELFSFKEKKKEEGREVPVFNLSTGTFERLVPISLMEGFEELRCLTFSSSLSQVADIVSSLGFKRVELIIGLADDYLAVSSAFSLDEGIGSLLLKGVDFSVYEAKRAHSKIYLLRGEGRSRVITGSANLSKVAWRGLQEEVFLFSDDEELFSYFEALYEGVKERAVQLVGSEEVERQRRELRNRLSLKVENLTVESADEETLREILKSVEALKRVAIANVVVKGVVDRGVLSKKEVELTRLSKALSEASKVLKEKKLISVRGAEGVKAVLSEEREDFKDFAFGITYRGGFKFNGLLEVPAPSREELLGSLSALSSLLEVLENSNPSMPPFLIESLLFSFAGAYVWYLRRERGENLVSYPIFGLLAGVSQGGKSLTLEVIKRLTGGLKYEFNRINLKGSKSKADIVNVYLCDERFGVNPLLLDEVPPHHLIKESFALYGRVKSFTNELKQGVYGSVISAFNINSGSVPVEILRRVFYVPFKRQLPRLTSLSPLLKRLNPSPFHLFLRRLDLGALLSLDLSSDPLLPAREFLRELSEELGVNLPISEKYLGSYEEFMLREWKSFYHVSRECFKEGRNERGEKVFKVKKEDLGHLAPVSYFTCESSSDYLVINREEFLRAIGEKEGFFKKLFRG